MQFNLISPFKPSGDQPKAIKQLTNGITKGYDRQTLLGVTGSGKTFTMANVIQNVQRPSLVIAHNKTLVAQLASEFQEFFPQNAVHYFVSYYDYYQPEAYIPSRDLYIEKESQINEEIDRLRHASTQALLSRKDVIIVASVSCIYGLGSPIEYNKVKLSLKVKETKARRSLLLQLVKMKYKRNDTELKRGTFSVKGEVVEIFPTFSNDRFYRFRFFGDELERIEEIHYLQGNTISTLETVDIYPATHYIPPQENVQAVLEQIERDMRERVKQLKVSDKLLEAQRLEQRTTFDLDMIQSTGFCPGIENYSRYFDGRLPGTPPYTLLDYFPKDFLLFIDESHMTVPQIRGMYEGDKARKTTLVEYGFRLPAAMDNRPLNFKEFEVKIGQTVFVSATPAEYELKHSKQIVEQVVRPTGLLDPVVEVRKTAGQIEDLVKEIEKTVKKKQRVLVTTLTKRLAEDLTEYLQLEKIKVQYLHSDVESLDRIDILRDLRLGKYDVVVGINLLREGLDLPEVSLVAILDADKEGFLRSDTSLIQTMGRAARALDGRVIMYGDKMTGSMKRAIEETKRRRELQESYNKEHGITPQGIVKSIRDNIFAGGKRTVPMVKIRKEEFTVLPKGEQEMIIRDLENQMELAAKNLEFERAAGLRDQVEELGGRKKTKGW
ncbi:MAG: excinuclease ABC subunit UvrB [bacterium]